MTYREITVSAYVMTEDPFLASSAAERLQAVCTAIALEGNCQTVVKVDTVDSDDDEATFVIDTSPDDPYSP